MKTLSSCGKIISISKEWRMNQPKNTIHKNQKTPYN